MLGLFAGLLLAAQTADVPDLRTRKTGADWPGFLGPTQDGKSPEKGVKWPPKVVWQRDLGESYGAPSIQRGRLFHFDRFGKKARLSCMKSETGDELWRFEYDIDYADNYGADNGPRCCPVVDDDRVYILGPEGMLYCVGVVDGKERWKKDTSRDFNVSPNFFGVGSTPRVDGDLLIVHIGGSPPGTSGVVGDVRGHDSGIVAFDKRTGQVKYKISDELASYSSPTIATIKGRRWGFVYARGGLLGFDPAGGKVEFHHPWRAAMHASVNACNPVVVDDRVFVSEAYGVGGAVLRVKAGGVDVLWEDGRKRDRSFMAWWNTPIHVDGFLYGDHGQAGELRCIEFGTGKVRWSKPAVGHCSLLHVDGHFVSLSENGVLRLVKVNPDRCEEAGEVDLKLAGPTRAAPVLSHGLLYVRGRDRLICLELIP